MFIYLICRRELKAGIGDPAEFGGVLLGELEEDDPRIAIGMPKKVSEEEWLGIFRTKPSRSMYAGTIDKLRRHPLAKPFVIATWLDPNDGAKCKGTAAMMPDGAVTLRTGVPNPEVPLRASMGLRCDSWAPEQHFRRKVG